MEKHCTVEWVCLCTVFCSIASCFRAQYSGQTDRNDDTRFQQQSALGYRLDGENFTLRSRRYEDPYKEDGWLRKDEPIISGVLVEDEDDQPFSGKVGKREAPDHGFYEETKKLLLDLHNMYRSNVTPPASNMEHMEWDVELERLAQLWANDCEFEHGYPPDTEYSKGLYGQNLYLGHDPTGLNALWLWYDEYRHYDMRKLICKPNEQCGHYVQMAWGSSNRLGCGIRKCKKKTWIWLIVCHYFGPAIRGQQMYDIGIPCSQCPDPKGSLCRNNLCFSWDQCDRQPHLCADAHCNLKCHNCGQLNSSLCKCECADGFDGTDCSRTCDNLHNKCGMNPGFPDQSTCFLMGHSVARKWCRKMCGSCKAVEAGQVFDDTCCEGKACEGGSVLDFDGKVCGCTLLCPGPKCGSGLLHQNRPWYLIVSLLVLYSFRNINIILLRRL